MFKKNIVWIFLVVTYLFNTTLWAESNNELPNWIDSSKEFIERNYQSAVVPYSPPHGFQLRPEFHPVKAVVVGWAGYTNILHDIGKIVTTEGSAEFWALQGPTELEGISQEKYKRLMYLKT